MNNLTIPSLVDVSKMDDQQLMTYFVNFKKQLEKIQDLVSAELQNRNVQNATVTDINGDIWQVELQEGAKVDKLEYD
jgi:preprotein translocase subunit SecD